MVMCILPSDLWMYYILRIKNVTESLGQMCHYCWCWQRWCCRWRWCISSWFSITTQLQHTSLVTRQHWMTLFASLIFHNISLLMVSVDTCRAILLPSGGFTMGTGPQFCPSPRMLLFRMWKTWIVNALVDYFNNNMPLASGGFAPLSLLRLARGLAPGLQGCKASDLPQGHTQDFLS